jgi:hypothetical protein
MGWVRFHRRYGAWLGLAALALQIVLSFGHIHIGNVHVAGAIGGIAAAKSHAPAQWPQKSPAQNSGHHDDDDYCAICASIFLASTSLAAQAPQLAVPLGFERVALIVDIERGIGASRPAFFQSRAPPIV